MSIEDWLHKRAEENAHNEILAFLMLVLAVNLLTGGLLVIIIAKGEPNWLLSFPYVPLQFTPAQLGLFLVVTGFTILAAGSSLVVYYNGKRSRYTKEIGKSSIHKEKSVLKSVDELLEEYTGKRKKR